MNLNGISTHFYLIFFECEFSYYFSICVCHITCISVTSVTTELGSRCQVMRRVSGTASTWVQCTLFLYQLKYITFWSMVSNYLRTNIPGLNRTLRYSEHNRFIFLIRTLPTSQFSFTRLPLETFCHELHAITCQILCDMLS
jgi:hypothetical protein